MKRCSGSSALVSRTARSAATCSTMASTAWRTPSSCSGSAGHRSGAGRAANRRSASVGSRAGSLMAPHPTPWRWQRPRGRAGRRLPWYAPCDASERSDRTQEEELQAAAKRETATAGLEARRRAAVVETPAEPIPVRSSPRRSSSQMRSLFREIPVVTPEIAFAARAAARPPEPERPLPTTRRAIFFDVENTSRVRAHRPRHRPPRGRPPGPPHRLRRRRQLAGHRPRHRAPAGAATAPSSCTARPRWA